MKQSTLCLGAAVALASSLTAHAVEINHDLSLNLLVTGASDYRTGGISQTRNNPTLQFDVSLQHSSGLLLGVFTSNVDFDTDTRREYDYYAGIIKSLTDNISASLIYYEYDYPKDSQFNYGEWIGTITAYDFTLGMKYTKEVKPYGDDRSVIWAGYSLDLPYGSSIDFRWGYSDAKDPIFISSSGSTRSGYRDWEVGVNKDFVGVNWRLSYVDTDLSRTECESTQGLDDICSATVMLSASKLF
ncbi:hypothetical protein IAE39_000599 [Pseudomonas sp. S37]|uniref:TorF family putative porin n=1 Tax=Pseudomonas sp. S37 TaxID=2767449 RepID=UPI001914067E|nr:TorF family putative porin [Pseudomonas sp. S37]MBK4992425.1 hypothetical protein [Pseudomonas sp. S37]